MLELDGARHEGGGQLLRTAVALAALTGEIVSITRIRAGRKTPGLMPQHLAAVRAVAGCCGARVDGLVPGSDQLVFAPGPLARTDQRIDVGTAGGIPLVLQAWLPVALEAGGAITITGGTEVPLGPTIDFVEHLLLRLLSSHGARVSLEIRRRGYAPKGGGEVRVEVEPDGLAPIDPGRVPAGSGIVSAAANLPRHVPERQLGAARYALEPVAGTPGEGVIDLREAGPSTGSSITCWIGLKAGSAIGRQGLRAERVGRTAADALLAEHALPGEVDRHLADQLLIYLARYGGAYTATARTRHAETVCWLLGTFGLSVDRVTRPDGSEGFSA